MENIEFIKNITDYKTHQNDIALFVKGGNDGVFTDIDAITGGAISRAIGKDDKCVGEWLRIDWPSGLSAKRIFVFLTKEAKDPTQMRQAGAALASKVENDVTLISAQDVSEFALGFGLRNYRFDVYRTNKSAALPSLYITSPDPEGTAKAFQDYAAIIAGTHLARDLVNEPANILTTEEFADRAQDLSALGVKVTVLDEDALENIGMRALLGVGQGSVHPSRVAVMHWQGAEGAPLALVGKGVTFDTGGISLKPGLNMHEMIGDMGGAATVVGAMHTIAARKANANIVGIIGIVENMPDGKAQRPGDIIRTLKGDTVEILNTDAEGRLVLADILWYVQDAYKPAAVIDLATLTGAVLVALGHDHAGLFSNDDRLSDKLLSAAKSQSEGLWRLPLAPAYAKLLKSRSADMANIGGPKAGSITAAEFLQKFIKDGTPWAHLDIAGAAYRADGEDIFAPKGPTGWGVMTLNKFIVDNFEG